MVKKMNECVTKEEVKEVMTEFCLEQFVLWVGIMAALFILSIVTIVFFSVIDDNLSCTSSCDGHYECEDYCNQVKGFYRMFTIGVVLFLDIWFLIEYLKWWREI